MGRNWLQHLEDRAAGLVEGFIGHNEGADPVPEEVGPEDGKPEGVDYGPVEGDEGQGE